MNTNQKKAIYEAIMKSVSKTVKRKLNENSNRPLNNLQKIILSYFNSSEIRIMCGSKGTRREPESLLRIFANNYDLQQKFDDFCGGENSHISIQKNYNDTYTLAVGPIDKIDFEFETWDDPNTDISYGEFSSIDDALSTFTQELSTY